MNTYTERENPKMQESIITLLKTLIKFEKIRGRDDAYSGIPAYVNLLDYAGWRTEIKEVMSKSYMEGYESGISENKKMI